MGSDIRTLTETIKSKGYEYGSDLVGVVSAKALDAVPSHWIGHRGYETYTKKTSDYMEDAKSLIILGNRVWDDLFEMVIWVRGKKEYPVEWRGRYYARRMVRYLWREGYKAVIEPELLSKKRMAQLAGFGNFGKNSLIINPKFGPWFRLRSILTDAELVPDEPYTDDLCGECEECMKACPVDALTPYKVDPKKCLLGMEYEARSSDKFREIYVEHSPYLTQNSWLMCTTCQKACPIGREERGL